LESSPFESPPPPLCVLLESISVDFVFIYFRAMITVVDLSTQASLCPGLGGNGFFGTIEGCSKHQIKLLLRISRRAFSFSYFVNI
jgi:hypothetical protein